MKTLKDVALRLSGMAQNAADRAAAITDSHPMYKIERNRMLEFIELARIIDAHVAECDLCKPSQSRSKSQTE